MEKIKIFKQITAIRFLIPENQGLITEMKINNKMKRRIIRC